jgi:hypothetical protein
MRRWWLTGLRILDEMMALEIASWRFFFIKRPGAELIEGGALTGFAPLFQAAAGWRMD